MTILVELLATTPIVPPIPEPESPGPWSPAWYTGIFVAIGIIGALLFGAIVLAPGRWFKNGLSPIKPMFTTLGMIVVGIFGGWAGTEYYEHVHDVQRDEYSEASADRYDAVTSALNEAYGITILRDSPDMTHRTFIPNGRVTEEEAVVEHPDGTIQVCALDYTPTTYILTCPAPTEEIA
ncbi:hypothetical protein [Paraoerskovia marina]|uniref:hypothetical protein n=1 Tax=Paraoerskovia marina TaxID=545619 RepID=UPI000492DB15|nr:hypothetical protein [Paraoerskovia marina]